MNSNYKTRAAAMLVSIVISFSLIQAVALIGHPADPAQTEIAVIQPAAPAEARLAVIQPTAAPA